MASAAKQLPNLIFVINNGYENRFYATVKSFATALADGYGHRPVGRNGGVKPADIALYLPATGVQVALDKVFEYDLGSPASAEELKERSKAAKAHFEALLNDIIDSLPQHEIRPQ